MSVVRGDLVGDVDLDLGLRGEEAMGTWLGPDPGPPPAREPV